MKSTSWGDALVTTHQDWATDFDLFDPDYIRSPYVVWDELRSSCPVAHSDRYGGSWLTTTYNDVTTVARDPGHFSSRNVSVVPPDGTEEALLPAGLPPIQADPPVHTWTRRVLLPWFSNGRVAEYEPYTRTLCRGLLDRFAHTGRADAAADYAKQIPVRVIGKILGVPESMSDTFIEWVRGVLEFANDGPRRTQAQIESVSYFLAEIEARRAGDGTDLISEMLRTKVDGQAIPDEFILGTVALTLIAGFAPPGRRSDRCSGTWPLTPKTADGSWTSPNCCRPQSRRCCAPTHRSRWRASLWRTPRSVAAQ